MFIVSHGTSLSNLNELFTHENDITKIHGLTPQSEIQFNINKRYRSLRYHLQLGYKKSTIGRKSEKSYDIL